MTRSSKFVQTTHKFIRVNDLLIVILLAASKTVFQLLFNYLHLVIVLLPYFLIIIKLILHDYFK